MNRIGKIVSAVTMLLVMGSANHAFAQQPKDDIAVRMKRQNWMETDFTLDNSGYAATRAAIDKAVRSGQNPATLEARYRLRDNEKYDSQKIFRWAYAAYRLGKVDPKTKVLMDADEALDRNLRPGAYDWVRLRFLLTSQQRFLKPVMPLIALGRRLLEIEPKDEEVIFHFVRDLQDSETLSDRKQAVSLAQMWVKKYPRDLYWQWTLADSWRAVTFITRQRQDNTETVAQYKKTLQMLPAGHPYRKGLIEAIVRYSLDFDAAGRRQKVTRQMIKEALENTSLR